MRPLRNSIVTSLLTLLLCAAAAAAGEPVGKVTHLSGPLFAKRADAVTKALSQNSTVEQGDILVSEKRTYARIKFNDNSEMTLRPNTQVKIEKFAYNETSPKDDSAVFDLVKGGLRAVTGQVGKRGDPDSYKMKTPTATIGIRGTIYECRICLDNCGNLPNGLYFYVAEGTIAVTNKVGALNISAGQFAYAKSPDEKPVILPRDPGLKLSIPPSVAPSSSSQGQSGDGGDKKVDCTVR